MSRPPAVPLVERVARELRDALSWCRGDLAAASQELFALAGRERRTDPDGAPRRTFDVLDSSLFTIAANVLRAELGKPPWFRSISLPVDPHTLELFRRHAEWRDEVAKELGQRMQFATRNVAVDDDGKPIHPKGWDGHHTIGLVGEWAWAQVFGDHPGDVRGWLEEQAESFAHKNNRNQRGADFQTRGGGAVDVKTRLPRRKVETFGEPTRWEPCDRGNAPLLVGPSELARKSSETYVLARWHKQAGRVWLIGWASRARVAAAPMLEGIPRPAHCLEDHELDALARPHSPDFRPRQREPSPLSPLELLALTQPLAWGPAPVRLNDLLSGAAGKNCRPQTSTGPSGPNVGRGTREPDRFSAILPGETETPHNSGRSGREFDRPF